MSRLQAGGFFAGSGDKTPDAADFAGSLKNRRISSCFAENSDYINRRQQMREKRHVGTKTLENRRSSRIAGDFGADSFN